MWPSTSRSRSAWSCAPLAQELRGSPGRREAREGDARRARGLAGRRAGRGGGPGRGPPALRRRDRQRFAARRGPRCELRPGGGATRGGGSPAPWSSHPVGGRARRGGAGHRSAPDGIADRTAGSLSGAARRRARDRPRTGRRARHVAAGRSRGFRRAPADRLHRPESFLGGSELVGRAPPARSRPRDRGAAGRHRRRRQPHAAGPAGRGLGRGGRSGRRGMGGSAATLGKRSRRRRSKLS